METALPKNDKELHKCFEIISFHEELPDHIYDIAQLICHNSLTTDTLRDILYTHGIDNIADIKLDLLDLLLKYIDLVLKDDVITINEKRNIEILKKYFHIKEGDFYQYRYKEIKEILHLQFEKMYHDNLIEPDEAIHNVKLQDIFDLSYDQFDQFKEEEIKKAIMLGANITDLDTAIDIQKFKNFIFHLQ